jgi:hypothetical protein
VTQLRLADEAEAAGLAGYLDRLLALDPRAAVRVQAGGRVCGVWSGPPFQALALRPVALTAAAEVDQTVSGTRLRERLDLATQGSGLELPPSVPGPSWVGLLPPRTGWEERGRASTRQVRESVKAATQFFRLRAEGVTERVELDAIAADVWERAALGEVPVRAAHAAEALGLLGPDDGEVVALAAAGWQRLRAPGGSVAVRRQILPGLGLVLA